MIIPHPQIRDQVLDLYRAGGLPKGQSTGWPSVDKFYTVGLAQWTLITGTPNSGKSEWLDALIVNLSKAEPWRFYIFSPENWPLALHHSMILEKFIGKPFTHGPTERMTEQDVLIGEDWIADRFFFCKPDVANIAGILGDSALAEPAGGNGKLGVVIDPWNQLEHYRPNNLSETEYVSRELSTIIEWVRAWKAHLWLVAHPSKLQKTKDGRLPVPTPHDVSGSAHFWNKADNCVTVWRDQVEGSREVDIHVQKVRRKNIGRIGMTTLHYDRITGRYHEPLRLACDLLAKSYGEER